MLQLYEKCDIIMATNRRTVGGRRMKKQTVVNAVVYLICFVVACILNLAVSWLLLKIVDAFVALDYFGESVVRIVSGFLTGGVVIGAVVGRECFKSLEFRPLSLVASLAMAGGAHLLLCLLLMFYPFIAGGVRDLAGVIGMGSKFDSASEIEKIYLWQYLLAFVIDLVYRIGIALLAGYLGKATRLKNRENLKGFSGSEK